MTYWLFAYKNSLLQAYQRSDVASKITILTTTLQYAIQLVILWLFHNYYLYIIVMLFTQAMANVITAIAASRLYPDMEPNGNLPDKTVKTINQRITGGMGSSFSMFCTMSILVTFIKKHWGQTP